MKNYPTASSTKTNAVSADWHLNVKIALTLVLQKLLNVAIVRKPSATTGSIATIAKEYSHGISSNLTELNLLSALAIGVAELKLKNVMLIDIWNTMSELSLLLHLHRAKENSSPTTPIKLLLFQFSHTTLFENQPSFSLFNNNTRFNFLKFNRHPICQKRMR